MNSLVGYGSSDEDDNDQTTVPVVEQQPRKAAADSTTNSSTDIGPSRSDQIIDAQNMPENVMVGPSMPHYARNPTADLDGDAEQELPPLSERDLLRYLTQPSHPVSSLPPDPTSETDSATTAKFKRFLELKAKGIHFNEDLAGKSSFKNPNLFASLLERSGLPSESQHVSTLTSHAFNVDMLPPWAYKEELLKSQQALTAELGAVKKAQSAAGKRRIEFSSAGDSRSRESTPKRMQK